MQELEIRIAPTYGFMIECDQFGGGKFKKGFRLCLDMAAFIRIKEKTGLELWDDLGQWAGLQSSQALVATFWAATLRHHPEYSDDKGFDAIASYIDPSNANEIVVSLLEALSLVVKKESSEKVRRMIKAITTGEIDDQDPQTAPDLRTMEDSPSA